MVSTLERVALGFMLGLVVAAATTTINPIQSLQTGKNLVQYFVPGAGWFVDANTATLATKTTLQSGSATRCVSANGTFAYTCGTCQVNGQPAACNGGLNPVGTPATVVPGMELEFIPDVPCAAVQLCTLNVDFTGLLTIKANDGGNNGVAISGNGHIIHRLGVDQISGQLVWRLIY